MKDSKPFRKKPEEWLSYDKTLKEKILKRKKVNKALEIHRDLFHKLYCEYKLSEVKNSKAKTNLLLDAAMFMKEKHEWENTGKRLGHVDGIEVGDHFQYRAELVVIGLHQQFTAGIDYSGKGECSLATSIVVTLSSLMVVWFMKVKVVILRDQKLEGESLALWNSMKVRRSVRVILKVRGKFDGMEEWKNSVSDYSYVYDGLYSVDCILFTSKLFSKAKDISSFCDDAKDTSFLSFKLKLFSA